MQLKYKNVYDKNKDKCNKYIKKINIEEKKIFFLNYLKCV